jgi:hypothetical protein
MNGKTAFPVRNRWDSVKKCYDLEDSGMTQKEYVAIHLKVPRSGDPEIDAMIRESVRRDFVDTALATFKHSDTWIIQSEFAELIAKQAIKIADIMLFEMEEEE